MPLSITGLSKRSNYKWAFRDVSLEIGDGEIVGIFGPTGSGKSSLLGTIGGIERPDGGTIKFADKLGRSDKKGFLHVAQVTPSIWRSLLGRRPQDTSRALVQAQALKKALGNLRSVLLLDNAFSEMDRVMRTEWFDKIRSVIRETGTSAIFASGDFGQILEFCDRAAVLIDGTIMQVGAPQDIYDSPANKGTASIVGRNNVFYARRLTSTKADLPEFTTIDGDHRLFSQRANLSSLGAINKNTALMIRPENITIAFGASFPEDNLLRATVVGTLPRGAVTFVQLDSNGLRLEALVLRLVGLNIGDECMIGLPPERIHVLAD